MPANDRPDSRLPTMGPQQADVEPGLVLHGQQLDGLIVGVNHAFLRFFVIASWALRLVSNHLENSRVPCGDGTLAIPATMRAWAGLTSLPTIR